MEKAHLLSDLSTSTMSSPSQVATASFAIEGMTCGACVAAITNGLEELDGVSTAAVSLVTERATVTYDSSTISGAELKERIEDCGFDARLLSETLPRQPEPSNSNANTNTNTKMAPLSEKPSQEYMSSVVVAISGMTCGACSSSITNNLEALEGVQSVAISLITERGAIEFDSNKISAEKIIQEIEDTGFDATLVSSSPIGQQQPLNTSPSHTTAPTLDSQFQSQPQNQNLHNNSTPTPQTLKIKVYGMTCSSCSNSVESILRDLPGVSDALVNLVLEEATVYYNSNLTGPRSIVEAINDAGFTAVLASTADNALQLESLSKAKAIVHARNQFILSTLFAIPVILLSHLVPKNTSFLSFLKVETFIKGLFLNDIICLILTIPIQFVIGLRFYKATIKAIRHKALTMDVLVCLSTTCAFSFSLLVMVFSIIRKSDRHPHTLWETPAMITTFILGGKYLENKAKGQTSKALSKLIQLSPSMANIYTDTQKYRDTIQSTPKADSANSSVLAVSEETAGGESSLETKSVPTELVQNGDIVLVLPGETIPADGIVIRGETYVDESFVTGEFLSVSKIVGSQVICGSVNGFGRIDVQVTHSGSETKLSHIVQLVQDAQTSKTSIQRYADYVAGKFVPTVIFLGFVTFVTWMIISHVKPNLFMIFSGPDGKVIGSLRLAISVIVVACPCALGLATPTAVMVGTGVGASNGILIKGGAVLETASRITTVLFDKTGTLTTGDMTVSSFGISPSSLERLRLSSMNWWKIVGCIEQGSEHPVARGVMKTVKEKCGLSEKAQVEGTVENFVVKVGYGVSASVKLNSSFDFMNVSIGSSKLMNQEGVIDIPENVRELESRSIGESLVLVSIDGVYSGYICISDTIRHNAAATVSALKKLGLSVGIVSGDHPSVVARVAEEVGISKDMAWGSVSPEGKLEIVDQLQSDDLESSIGSTFMGQSTFNMMRFRNQKEVVAMVGDGINDSPALARATLGISMAGATDIAMDAADIVLLKENSLLDVAAAFQLCYSIFSCIRFNLIWAVLYNVVTIPIAMGIFLPWGISMHPAIAGGAMAFSSVSVVCNSLLLQFWKRPKWLRTLYKETSTGINSTTSTSNTRRNNIRQSNNTYEPLDSADSDTDEDTMSESATVVGSPTSTKFASITIPSQPSWISKVKSVFGLGNSTSKSHNYSLLPQ